MKLILSFEYVSVVPFYAWLKREKNEIEKQTKHWICKYPPQTLFVCLFFTHEYWVQFYSSLFSVFFLFTYIFLLFLHIEAKIILIFILYGNPSFPLLCLINSHYHSHTAIPPPLTHLWSVIGIRSHLAYKVFFFPGPTDYHSQS